MRPKGNGFHQACFLFEHISSCEICQAENLLRSPAWGVFFWIPRGTYPGFVALRAALCSHPVFAARPRRFVALSVDLMARYPRPMQDPMLKLVLGAMSALVMVLLLLWFAPSSFFATATHHKQERSMRVDP